MTETNPDVGQLTFERAIEELETIVKRLEEGKVPLEESVAIYERGETLKRRCEQLLRQAEARVEKIALDASGKPTGTEPLDGKNDTPKPQSATRTPAVGGDADEFRFETRQGSQYAAPPSVSLSVHSILLHPVFDANAGEMAELTENARRPWPKSKHVKPRNCSTSSLIPKELRGCRACTAASERLAFVRHRLLAVAHEVLGNARSARKEIVPSLDDEADNSSFADLNDFNVRVLCRVRPLGVTMPRSPRGRGQ